MLADSEHRVKENLRLTFRRFMGPLPGGGLFVVPGWGHHARRSLALESSSRIARLQVAMGHALPMRLIKSVGNLNPVTKPLISRHGSPFESGGQRLTFQELEDEVVDAVLVTNVVQRADVGMVQVGNDSGLALKALAPFGVGGEFRRRHLDGHGPVQARVPGAVDLPHASRTEGSEDFVGSEFSTRGQHGDPLSPLRIYGSRPAPTAQLQGCHPRRRARPPVGTNRAAGANYTCDSDYRLLPLKSTSVYIPLPDFKGLTDINEHYLSSGTSWDVPACYHR
jgi:hypothetical protein